MKTSYKPSKLPAIAAQVRKEHPTSSEIRNYQLDNSFLDEVRQWAKLPKEDVDGETYHFITEEQFNDMIEKDLFAEHASYNGWQYGTAKEDCTDDKVVVLTPHGLRQLKKNKDLHIISFYIDVPRRDRLIKILERGDDIEEAYRRNLSDVGQFDGIKDEVDYVISNKGYSWSPLNMAHIIKRSMEWMKC